jgi:anti-sigma factor RsiW
MLVDASQLLMSPRDLSPRNCLLARRRLSLHLDDELPAAEEELLDMHLATCAGCRAWAADLVALVSTVRAAALDRPTRTWRVERREVPSWRVVAACAAVAAVGLISIHVGSGGPSVTEPQSLAAVKTQMTLKERQLTAIDKESRTYRVRPRPSIPAGMTIS